MVNFLFGVSITLNIIFFVITFFGAKFYIFKKTISKKTKTDDAVTDQDFAFSFFETKI